MQYDYDKLIKSFRERLEKKCGLMPFGTMAHEWIMCTGQDVAKISDTPGKGIYKNKLPEFIRRSPFICPWNTFLIIYSIIYFRTPSYTSYRTQNPPASHNRSCYNFTTCALHIILLTPFTHILKLSSGFPWFLNICAHHIDSNRFTSSLIRQIKAYSAFSHSIIKKGILLCYVSSIS